MSSLNRQIAYAIDIDEAFLSSLSSSSSLSSAFPSSSLSSLSPQEDQETRGNEREEEGEGEALPILRRFNVDNSNNPNYDNMLCESDFSYDKPETYQNIQELQNNKEEEEEKEEKHFLYYDGLVLKQVV